MEPNGQFAQTALAVGRRAAQQRDDVGWSQRFELKQLAAADQRAVHGEKRVGSRGADQRHDSLLDVWQQRVLLGFVETMDFVDEQQRPRTARQDFLTRGVQQFAQFLDAAGHGVQSLELAAAFGGEQSRERRLPGPGRSGKNHRREPVGFEQSTQEFTGPEKMLLSHEFVEPSGPHPGRERLRASQVGGLGAGEQRCHRAPP